MDTQRTPEALPETGRLERKLEKPGLFPVEQPESRPELPPQEGERPAKSAGPVFQPKPPARMLQDKPQDKPVVVREIEQILAEDLDSLYRSMDLPTQQRFRAEGERVAGVLGQLVLQIKVKTKTVLLLIRNWLRLIPGVNRFFLEQEAKIKADQVIALAKQKGIEKLQALLEISLPASGIGLPVGSSQDVARAVSDQPVLSTLVFVALAFVVAIILVAVIRYLVRRMNRLSLSLQYVVLRLTVPKEAGLKQDQSQQPKDPKEALAQAETLFLNLGGIRPERHANILHNGWNNFWFGRSDHLAFEIVANKGLISFYAVVPRHLQRLVELQIHAQYPRASIEEVEDYNIFSVRGSILGTYLGLTKESMFQIRTYKKLDTDPLNALTNVMSKLKDNEGAAIQLLIRPVRKSWRGRGQRVAWHMQKGKTFEQAMSLTGSNVIWTSLKHSLAALPSTFTSKKPEDQLKKETLPPYLTPMEQELVKALEEKASKNAFHANLRVVVSSPAMESARSNLINIVNAFSQYSAQESSTGFRKKPLFWRNRFIRDFIYRHFNEYERIILNTEEVTSLFHLPLPTTETPNILWLQARKAPAPVNVPTEGVILGKNVYRGVETTIHLKRDDRRRHVYIIGMTGVGKSVLMEEMAKQDIRDGEGVCIVDPHGSFVEAVLSCIPKERADDVIIFDPADTERPVGLNMLEAETLQERDFAVQEMIAIFYKLFPPEMIGPMFEHNMRNAMLTLMEDVEYPGTIADIPRIFTDKAFQQFKLKKVHDPVVRAFWEKEMAKTSDFHKSEMLGYLISKVGRFVENAMMRNIIGQPRSGFNFREVMDQKKILLVNLSKGKIGEVNAALLGLIIVSKLQMAALARANVPESRRTDFYLYIDEFQNFITDSIATILSEARKYKLNLIMAHQYMGQLVQGQDTKVRDAVLGNIGTMVAFRIGVDDAEILAKQFAPVFDEFDLINQERFVAYVKLLINNTAGKPFSMATSPPSPGNPAAAQALKQLSHLRYGRDRQSVEAELLKRTRLGEAVSAQPPVVAERKF